MNRPRATAADSSWATNVRLRVFPVQNPAAPERCPGDGPSRTMLARIARFETNPPAADWDGAWRLDGK